MQQIITRQILNINERDWNSKTALIICKYFEKYFLKKESFYYPQNKLISCSKLPKCPMYLFSVRY
jgi:hypothetical protein